VSLAFELDPLTVVLLCADEEFRSHDVPIFDLRARRILKACRGQAVSSFEIGANSASAVLDRVVTDSAVNVTFGLIDQLLDPPHRRRGRSVERGELFDCDRCRVVGKSFLSEDRAAPRRVLARPPL